MGMKEINTFLTFGVKHYKAQEKQDCGIAIQKDFSLHLAPLLEQDEEMEEDLEHVPEVHKETLTYLQARCENEVPMHSMIRTLFIADADLFSFWFLFGLSPYFSCYETTVTNAFKYKVSPKDPFLQETLNYLTDFHSIVTDFIDHFELEDWFIADLHNK